MRIEIYIATEFPGWEKCGFDPAPVIDKAVQAALKQSRYYQPLRKREGELSVVLGDDDFVQVLNRDYRHKDKPTNVLSFPQTDFAAGIPEGPLPLGDIILAYQTIKREADEQKKSFQSHFTHLIVHGTLHLLGYDHEKDEEAEEMENLEIAALKGMGIENPYSDANFMA